MYQTNKISSKLKILNGFVKNPEWQPAYWDLRQELKEFSETQIRKSLQELKKSFILMVDHKRGRPKGGSRSEMYSLSKDLEAFKKLFEIYIKFDYKYFLESRYLNNMVEYNGFMPIFNLVEKEFSDNDFKKVASIALMELPATIQEYKNHPNTLKEIPDSVVKGFPITAFEDDDIINILSRLDPLSAIEFYRKRVGNTYFKFYRELSLNNTCITKCMKKFIEYDIMLSPLMSYPVNDPIYLLFKRPYEKIYNNAFILNPMDRYRFVRRAHTVYSNFADILCSGINTLRTDEMMDLDRDFVDFEQRRRYEAINELEFREYRPLIELKSGRLNDLKNMRNNLETLVRLSIYHWNIAANRFNFIYNRLDKLMQRQDYKNKYYIYEDHGDIEIADLQRGESNEILSIRELKGDISLLSDIENSFKQLLPCKAFRVDMTRKPMTYNEILDEVRSKIIEPKLISSIISF